MMYIVHYFDDSNKQHMAFVKSFREVTFIKNHFGEVTVESFCMK